MDLYEYQGKELFRRYGLPTGEGCLARTPAEARAAAEELGGSVVVKAQVLTGGRGKAGGVKVATSPPEAETHAAAILGMDIKRHTVRRLWVERTTEIAREYYLSLTLDRGAKKPLFMFTTEGGVEIEEVAARNPEVLVRLHVDPLEGFHPWHGRALTFGAGIADAAERRQIERLCAQLYDAFTGCDATLCEINPLVVTAAGELLALDAKVSIDDNALYRHEDIAAMHDPETVPVEERAAREKGVTYVKLDGEIGILGNGAGLVMSTLDLVAIAGGRPANFCDLGGGGGAQGVVDALEVISADPQVRAIFFNVFGGITRCDEVARGILQALGQITIAQPIVVRFDGTNAEEGRLLLAEAGLPNLHAEPTMLEAAKRAVELAR
jgi:succinyl-CoA synthetase beta subunit